MRRGGDATSKSGLGLDKMETKPIQLTFQMSRSRGASLRAGSLRVKESVREALKRAVEACEMDRETIARELSRLVGEDVSIHTLNNWIADGKHDRRVPLEYAEALALITGDRGILDAAFSTFRVLDESQAPYYDLGVIEAEDRARRKAKRKALERIGV
jgi:hypothetical protein